jgi:excisionase family DNA binding protein
VIVIAGDHLRAHLGVAVSAHLRQLRRDGVRPPAELAALADALLASSVVPGGPERSELELAAGGGESERAHRLAVSVAEAAGWVGVSISTIRRLVSSGELPTVRIGRSVRIHVREFERYVSGTETKGASEWPI